MNTEKPPGRSPRITPRRIAAAAALAAALWVAFSFAVDDGAVNAARARVCAARDVLTRYLAKQFGERQVAVGVAAAGAVIEIFVSESGTWTILATVPGGPTCAVVAGEGWDASPLPSTGPKA